jgi:hypothetical protein
MRNLETAWRGRVPVKPNLSTARHWGLLGDEATEASAHGTAELCPLETAANLAGMSADLLEAGITAGEIPVVLRRCAFGNRRFVHVGQLKDWLSSRKAAAGANLFK